MKPFEAGCLELSRHPFYRAAVTDALDPVVYLQWTWQEYMIWSELEEATYRLGVGSDGFLDLIPPSPVTYAEFLSAVHHRGLDSFEARLYDPSRRLLEYLEDAVRHKPDALAGVYLAMNYIRTGRLDEAEGERLDRPASREGFETARRHLVRLWNEWWMSSMMDHESPEANRFYDVRTPARRALP
ncbi:MAG: hypothetical protein AAF492_15665 [Verrucomicrobiota bacterium]